MTSLAEEVVSRKVTPLERALVDACLARVESGPSWLRERRKQALALLQGRGLPTQRDEAFRNLPWHALANQAFSLGQGAVSSKALLGAEAVTSQGPVLWLVNGVAMTDAAQVKGLRFLPLQEAIEREELVRQHLAALCKTENGFTAINDAAFSDGWCIITEPGAIVECPVELRIVESSAGRGTLSLPRVFVVVSAGSQLSLVERHLSGTDENVLSSAVTEILVERDAILRHSRWVEQGNSTWSFAATTVRVDESAEYHSWSATASGRLVRHDLSVRLAAKAAKATLDGLYYGRKGQVVDQHTRVWHEQPEGETKECYRGVIEDEGRGIFDGIIYVGAGAMKTDARQENRNLLLGPSAIVHTKPHLEIDADDVSCSHGATVGQLDQEQVFYLRARGIAESQAKQVLTWAFVKEIVDRCPEAGLRVDVERTLSASVEGTAPQLERLGQ